MVLARRSVALDTAWTGLGPVLERVCLSQKYITTLREKRVRRGMWLAICFGNVIFRLGFPRRVGNVFGTGNGSLHYLHINTLAASWRCQARGKRLVMRVGKVLHQRKCASVRVDVL